jgi:hypothetical protein
MLLDGNGEAGCRRTDHFQKREKSGVRLLRYSPWKKRALLRDLETSGIMKRG